MLTKAEILKAAAARMGAEAVPVPEWDGDVFVRSISSKQRDLLDEIFRSGTDRADAWVGVRATVVSWSLCDADGVPHGYTPEEIAVLADADAGPIERLFDAASRLSRLGKHDVEKLEKNSEATRANASG